MAHNMLVAFEVMQPFDVEKGVAGDLLADGPSHFQPDDFTEASIKDAQV